MLVERNYFTVRLHKDTTMAEGAETAGSMLLTLYYGSILAAVVVMLLAAVTAVSNPVAKLSFLALLGTLVVALAVGLWRTANGDHTATGTGTAEDITYDPFSHPGDAAKHNWRNAIRGVQQQSDDDEE
jgi:hypothetical protein